jgi:hypothetical protein
LADHCPGQAGGKELAGDLGETKDARRVAAGLKGGPDRFSHAWLVLRAEEQFGTMKRTPPEQQCQSLI